MNYHRLRKRIDLMLEYESDSFLTNINLNDDVSDKLLDYQLLHVFNLISALRSYQCILDGSDTGTGKTYTTIAICKQLNLRPLIICPKSVISIWKNVCRYFNVEPLIIVNYETIKNGNQYDEYGNIVKSKYIIINDDLPNPYIWKLPHNSIIIFDEAHRCKNIKSQNADLLISTKNSKSKIALLSATISDTPKSFHIFGYMLGFYKSIKQGRNWINGMLREDKNSINNKISSINNTIYPFRGSRIKISELGDKFPDNQVSADSYHVDVNERRDLIKAYSNIDRLVEDKGENALVKLNKSREIIEKIKIPIIKNMIEEFMDGGYSVAVFVNFTQTLEILSKMFRNTAVVRGGQKLEERDNNIEDFQSNKKRLIICNIKSGGQGLSLHDIHGVPRVSIISPSFSSIELKQALGRIHRSGSRSPAIQRIIFCANSCEDNICNTIRDKLKFMTEINDSDLISFSKE